jgi:transposase-like protein
MIDFPITELMDDSLCLLWLERHLYPEGWNCPHCGSSERRLFRAKQQFPAYRCRACNGYYTLLTATHFAKTHQSPRTVVMLLRGVSRGEPTALLSRELEISYRQTLTLRHRAQQSVADSAPNGLMEGTEFEADELYQNAGEKKHATSRGTRPAKTTCE